MKSEKQTVSPLKRVHLNVSAGKRPSGKELMNAEPVEFIFGIGREGLTPFERRLSGKAEGEIVCLELYRTQVRKFFGHILTSPAIYQQSLPSFYVHMKIEKIETASPRDIVRAMARSTPCGGDCDCGSHE